MTGARILSLASCSPLQLAGQYNRVDGPVSQLCDFRAIYELRSHSWRYASSPSMPSMAPTNASIEFLLCEFNE